MEYNYGRKDNATLEGERFLIERRKYWYHLTRSFNSFLVFLQLCLAIFRQMNLNYERYKEELQDKQGNEAPSFEGKLEIPQLNGGF